MIDLLVIGYGNDLRSDDGAGRAVAEAVSELNLHGVEVRSLSQLTPELTLEITGRNMVVFVDADIEASELTVRRVSAGPRGDGAMTHHGDPATLLSLALKVGPPPEEAIVVSVPAANLQMGFELSERTARAVDEAVALITGLARTDGSNPMDSGLDPG